MAQNHVIRKTVYALAAVAVALTLAYAYYFILPPTMGDGPAGPPVPGEPFETVLSERPVVLLGLGDSVTAGYGASPGKAYLNRLFANPSDEFDDLRGLNLKRWFPNLVLENHAVSGSNSEECLEKQLPALKPYPVDTLGVVCLTTGGNDLIHFYGRTPPREGAMYGATLAEAGPWIENYGERLETILGGIRRLFPGGCQIFLANIYDPSDGVGDPEAARLPPWPDMLALLTAYNDIIRQTADQYEKVWLVDMHGVFLGHGVHARQFWRDHYDAEDPHYWYYENLEDPNDRGYDALRRVFLLAMIQAFEEYVGP